MPSDWRPFAPMSPGQVLRDELDARGWTATWLSERSGPPLETINGLLRGHRSITQEIAIALSQVFSPSCEHGLELDAAYPLDRLHDWHRRRAAAKRAAAGWVERRPTHREGEYY